MRETLVELCLPLSLRLLAGLVLASLMACASTTTQLTAPPTQPAQDFRYDLTGDINGTEFQGVGVVSLAVDNQYTLTVKSATSVDMIEISTCHRDWSDQDMPIEVGNWFEPNHGFTFKFQLVHGIEDLGTCLMRIGAYNKAGNPQAWAIIDFLTPDSTLPAVNKCDGDVGQAHGVSICQSKAGLDEEIDFATPVEIADATDPACKPKVPSDGMHWLYTLPPKECVLYLMEIAPPHRFHRHTFRGYQSIQVRSN